MHSVSWVILTSFNARSRIMNAKCIVEVDVTTLYNEKGEPAVKASSDTEDGAGSWIARIISEFFSRVGKTRPADYPEGPCAKIPGYLASEPKLKDIQTRVISIPFNWEGPAGNDMENQEEVGRMMGVNAYKLFLAWRPAMLSFGIPEAEVDQWIKEAEVDLATLRYKVYMNVHYWTGSVAG